jgi:hypothetical protein
VQRETFLIVRHQIFYLEGRVPAAAFLGKGLTLSASGIFTALVGLSAYYWVPGYPHDAQVSGG